MSQLAGKRPVAGQIEAIALTFYPRTKRASDLTNRAESVMDLLVDGKIIPDDNWFVVPRVHLIFGGVDKAFPRVEIAIYETP